MIRGNVMNLFFFVSIVVGIIYNIINLSYFLFRMNHFLILIQNYVSEQNHQNSMMFYQNM